MTVLSPEEAREMEFLRAHLPESDLCCYDESLFLQFIDHSLLLRRTLPWCACLEEEIFDHYVLFPRVNDEDLSFHRRIFYDALLPRVEHLPTMAEKVLEVNRWCHETASYRSTDLRTASPLTVFQSGFGRCGEESAFLVSALRSVGIPARQVYVPRWAHCDDNHAWVEALWDGAWHFLGACEPEPAADLGWFNTPASRAVLVHSRLFGEGTSPLHGPLLSREGGVCWYNQTARYARVRRCVFRAEYRGAPAAGGSFSIQLLNEAGFHTIARLTADDQGQAQADFGIGDLHVFALWHGMTAEGDCLDGTLTLSLQAPREEATDWEPFDVRAPGAARINPTSLTKGQQADRAAVLERGNRLRRRRAALWEAPAPKWGDLLTAARGNRGEIAAFLRQDDDPRREAMVRTLTEKDLRDVTRETLEDHLRHTRQAGALPPDIYNRYVLCPRIAWEPLRPWRGELMLPHVPTDPVELWRYLCRRIDTQVTRVYSNLVWTPAESWRSGRCDRKSLSILYVAFLRTLGIPGRLRPLDGIPEYWQDGCFHPVFPEETGTLCLSMDSPLRRQDWSLSRRRNGQWEALSLPDGVGKIPLPSGQYRLITSLRLPNGNQFASKREFLLSPGEEVSVTLSPRRCTLEDMLRKQPLPPVPAAAVDGQPVPDVFRTDGRPSLVCWLEVGREPTEHLLGELLNFRAELEGVNVLFLPQSLEDPLLRRVTGMWPEARVLLDNWSYDLETVARHLTCDPDTPPLAVVCDGKGQAVYGISGYQAGSGELLARISDHIRKNVN